MLGVGSPIGYALRNRYLNPGVPLSEALARNDDKVFREKLVEFARWGKDEVRAAALVVLARDQDPAHLGILKEALVHLDAGVRFGAIEALILWGNQDKAGALLAAASERDPEPILRVYAAQGLARLDDPRGLEKLRAFLDDPGWLVRAMSARYLGEYGKASDYTGLIGRIGREQGNDFVLAEYCIAALKLYRRKSQ
jgi:HEAT repeat protein